MATIYKWRLYCNTESANVEGWSETPPTVCYNNSDHSIDLSSVSQIDIVDESKVEISGFKDLTGYDLYFKGYRFVATAGQSSVHSISYTSDMKLQGLGFRVDGNAVDSDHIRVEIVDADGVVYPAGTVLATFADTVYVWPNREFRYAVDDAKTVPSWAYLNVTYTSTGSSDVVVLVDHIMRTMPA